MAYANTSDLQQRMGTVVLVQLTDDTGSGEIDQAKVAEALEGAQGEVDSYVARRCGVPVDVSEEPSLGAVLKSITLDLAAHRLHTRRPPVPDDVRRKRAAAVQWLERVAAGEVVLPSSTAPAGNPVTGSYAEAASNPRVLTRETMEGL